MPATKLSALLELAATPATDDELYIRDISEIAADESKRITVNNLSSFYDSRTATLTNKTLTSPVIGTQLTLDQTTADYTLSWSDPAAARAISIPDPLGTDVFVFRDMTQTLLGKTLTTPTIAATGWTNATHAHAAANSGGQLSATDVFSAGTVPTARLGSGAASATTFLRGDQTWTTPGGSGDVVGPAASIDNAIVRFDGTTGKLIQDYTSGAPTIGDTGAMTLANTLALNDDIRFLLGTGGPSGIQWETADANANYLQIQLPAGGAVDVPVIVIGEALDGVDLGLYNGVVNPLLALMGSGAVATAPIWDFRKARGTLSAPTVITTGDDLGSIRAFGYSGAGGYVEAARIEFDSTGTIATTRVPGLIRFSTGTDAAPTVLTTRLTIDSAGLATFANSVQINGATGNVLVVDTDAMVVDATNNRVGVGLTNPASAFHIAKDQVIAALGSAVDSNSFTQVRVGGLTNINKIVTFTFDTTNNYGLIAAVEVGVVWNHLALQPNSSGVPTLYIMTTGNVKIQGVATRATTEGTNHLDIFDGTAPVGTLTNGVSLYSTAGELRVMDSGGTATLLSPHDDDGYWVFDSVNTQNGRGLRIDVEKMLRRLNELFGWDFIKEFSSA